MGYKCDVCEAEEGAVFCFADQAVMCAACDARVHSANKLAQKHERVAVTANKDCGLCDICQERRALLFCCEDRALLCRQCDLSIHKANQFTAAHRRLLLSGLAPAFAPLPAFGEPGAAAASPAALSGNAEGSANNKVAAKAKHSAGGGVSRSSAGQYYYGSAAQRAAGGAGPGPGTSMGAHGGMGQHGTRGDAEACGSNGLAGAYGGAQQLSHTSSGTMLLANTAQPAATGAGLLQPSPFAGSAAFDERGAAGGGPRGASGSEAVSNAGRGGYASTSMTLAAELLGIMLPESYTAKDFDVAYIEDESLLDDLDADLSSILAVPDMDFPSCDDYCLPPLAPRLHAPPPQQHSASSPSSAGAVPSTSAAPPLVESPPADGVVPDFFARDAPATKRQRV